MNSPKVLVAGVGNMFLGDDGFGSEVVRRLDAEALPAGVRVVDYGIGGIHLAYELLAGYDTLVLVDTISRGERPGSVYVLELDEPDGEGAQLDAHGMNPAAVFSSLKALGGRWPRTLLVGCEPASVDAGIGLSPAVAGAVEVAADAVRDLANDVVSGNWTATTEVE